MRLNLYNRVDFGKWTYLKTTANKQKSSCGPRDKIHDKKNPGDSMTNCTTDWFTVCADQW